MRRIVFVLCFSLCFWCAPPSVLAQGGLDQRVSELSKQIADKMSARQKTTIAVVEFTDLQGNVTDFGRFLAEELITRLYDAGTFKVIERQLLNRIVAEQKLSLTGIIDPASAKQLGKVLGVDAIVSGSITNLAQSIRVNARLISTETGEIFAVASTEVFKDESVTGLLANAGGGSSSTSPKQTTQPSNNKSLTTRVKGFTFELNSCRMAADEVLCHLTITNNNPEPASLQIHSMASRLFDESGTEYVAKASTLGTRTGMRATNELVPEVPTKASVKFEELSTRPTKATLDLEMSSRKMGYFKVTFRNVAILK